MQMIHSVFSNPQPFLNHSYLERLLYGIPFLLLELYRLTIRILISRYPPPP